MLKNIGNVEQLRIFISYRRKESSGYSRLLLDRLRTDIPEADIFMDVEGIGLGEDWRSELANHLDAANVVLVLIGREWLTMTDASGQRRLDDPEDVTRWEITQALQGGKRVVPVLLEDVGPLQHDSLPIPLRPLADMQAIKISHETFSAGLDALIDQVSGRSLRATLKQERGRRIVAQARQWTIPVVALSVFLLAWVSLLDLLTLDTRAATWTLALADALAPPPFDAQVRLVAIPESVDPRAPQTRIMYGMLAEKLSAKGARAIVFDLYFHESRPSDGSVAQSFRNAVAAGTDIFIGFTQSSANTPRSVPVIAEATSGMGLACAGRRLGYAVNMPMAFNIAGKAPLGAITASHLPSLALLGFAGPVSVTSVDAVSSSLILNKNDGTSMNLAYSLLDPVHQPQRGCPALEAGTLTASILLRLSPLKTLRAPDRRLSVEDVLADRVSAGVIDGHIVIVGYETKAEQFRIAYRLSRETRYGYELYADSINTLETKRIAQPVGAQTQVLTMLVAAVAGAWLGVRLRRYRPLARRSTIGALAAAYVALAVIVAATGDLLMNVSYDLVAFVAAYAIMQRLAGKWLA